MGAFRRQRRLCEAIALSVRYTMESDSIGEFCSVYQAIFVLPATRSEATLETKMLAPCRPHTPHWTLPSLEMCGRRWNISVSYISPICDVLGPVSPVALETSASGVDSAAPPTPAGRRSLCMEESRIIQAGPNKKSTFPTKKTCKTPCSLDVACVACYANSHETEKRFLKPLICVVEPLSAWNGLWDALPSLEIPRWTCLKDASVCQLNTGGQPWCVVRIEPSVCLPVNQLKVGPSVAGELQCCSMRLEHNSVWDASPCYESAGQMRRGNALDDFSQGTCNQKGNTDKMKPSTSVYTITACHNAVKHDEVWSCSGVHEESQHSDLEGIGGNQITTSESSGTFRLSLTLPILSAKQRLLNEDVEEKRTPVEVYSFDALASPQSVNGFFSPDNIPTLDAHGASTPSRSYLLTALLLPGVTNNNCSVSHTMNSMAHATVDSAEVEAELKTDFSSMRKCSQRKRVRFLPISSSCIYEYQPFDWDAATPSSV